MSGEKICPYNIADCKNTTDDALQNYLTSIKFRQSHFNTHVKLGLGYAAVLVSAITFAYDYKLGFDATKHYTTGTVILYLLLNSAFTYWIWAVEKDVIFSGDWKGQKIEISTRVKKFDPTYRLTVRHIVSSPENNDTTEKEFTSKFMRWFTADGCFVAKPFQEWLATRIPLIGEADPKAAAAVESSSLDVAKAEASGVAGKGASRRVNAM